MRKRIFVVALLALLIVPLYTAYADIGNKEALQYLTRPPIVNSALSDKEFARFQGTINKALDLLQEKDPDAYIRVCLDIKQIGYQKETPETPTALAITQLDNVFITKLLFGRSDIFVPWLVAGILSHESLHASMYKYYSSVSLFGFSIGDSIRVARINQEEILAYQCGINTLIKLNAPDWTVNADRVAQQEYIDKLKK